MLEESNEEELTTTDEKSKIKNKDEIYLFIKGKKYYNDFYKELFNFNYVITYYINKYIMYFLITNIDHKKKYIIIKIGYTYNIMDRINELYKSHGILCYPIRLIEVNSQKEEKEFHNKYKNYKNSLYTEDFPKKRKTEDTEFYYGTPKILDEFDTYTSNIVLKKQSLEIEKEKTKQEEERTKQKQIEQKQIEEQTKQKQIELEFQTKQKQIELDFQSKIFNHSSELFLKYLEIINKELTLKCPKTSTMSF